MLPRVRRFVSLPMLALLLAIPAVAHADVDDPSCGQHQDEPTPGQTAAPLFTPSTSDPNTGSQFATALPLPAGTHLTAGIAVCRASLTLTPSPDAAAHLTLSFPRPLPGGKLASTAVHRFALKGSHLTLEIDAPAGDAPHVELSLPMGTTTDLAVVRGDLALPQLLGDAHIAIVKGDATLHLADADFATLECASILGGIRDRRPGGRSHGHMLSTWSTHGTGTASIEVSAVSGNLILLPRTS